MVAESAEECWLIGFLENSGCEVLRGLGRVAEVMSDTRLLTIRLLCSEANEVGVWWIARGEYAMGMAVNCKDNSNSSRCGR